MKNLTVTVEGNSLICTIDLSKSVGLSNKGQGPNLTVATTAGNKAVAELSDGRKIMMGLNCYTAPEAK